MGEAVVDVRDDGVGLRPAVEDLRRLGFLDREVGERRLRVFDLAFGVPGDLGLALQLAVRCFDVGFVLAATQWAVVVLED